MDNNKNTNNNIPSFQSMSNENIAYNEEKDININTNSKNNQMSHRSIKKLGNPTVYSQNNYEEQNNMGGNLKKKKDFEQSSVNIVPGYKNFVLDENNAAYDSIADMFTKDEIEQAFKILDYQGNNQITIEELTFFLESIGEQARPEEIEEMIKMCDLEGKGYVTKDEFSKLASGQSLAPIGQAYPPTEEMLKKKDILENLNIDEFQMQRYKNNMTQNQQGNNNTVNNNNTKGSKKNMQSTLMNATQNNDFTIFNQSRDITKSNIKNTMMENEMSMRQKNANLNMTTTGLNNTSVINKTNIQQASSYGLNISSKKEVANRKNIFMKWQKENKITPEKLVQLIKIINEIQRNSTDYDDNKDFLKDYRDFLKFLGMQDSSSHQDIFKLAQSLQQDSTSQDINSNGKYDLAFQMIGKEIISFEDLIFIEKRLTFLETVSEEKIRNKFTNQKNKKEYKSKPYGSEEMDKQFYLDLISSYPTCFQG